jgi:hypothetical protein
MVLVLLGTWALKGIGATSGEATVDSLYPFMRPRVMLFYGIIVSIGVSLWRRSKGADFKQEAIHFVEAARAGTENSLKIGATVGVIGVIIGVLTYSGLILTFADIVIELAAGSLPLTILFIALASLILGMGVPVTAAYLITAVVAVPALTHLGVNETGRPHDRLLALPGFQHHTARVYRGLCRRHHRQGQYVANRFCVLQVRQVPLSGALSVRLRAGLLDERQCDGHCQGLCPDHHRHLDLCLCFERHLD